MKEVLIALAVIYFAVMAVVFILSARHFVGWFINSTPPMGKLGSLIEGFSMFFDRYLTKEGIEHKNKCFRWLSIFLIMGVAVVLTKTILKNGA